MVSVRYSSSLNKIAFDTELNLQPAACKVDALPESHGPSPSTYSHPSIWYTLIPNHIFEFLTTWIWVAWTSCRFPTAMQQL